LLIPLLWFFLIICNLPLYARQDIDSTRVVSSSEKVNHEVKSTKTAMIRSALLPGWGQWYNGKKLKALFVFGVEAGLMANAIYFNQKFVASKTEYEREFYYNNKSLYLWWFGAVYLLNILDAFVDAYLSDFDVSEDLSFEGRVLEGRGVMFCFSWKF